MQHETVKSKRPGTKRALTLTKKEIKCEFLKTVDI